MTDLRADCASCFALCCTALTFARSADFPVSKPAGEPCAHLQDDLRCGIHHDLLATGYRGCAAFDCFGAGQRLSQDTFGGRDWRDRPELRAPMFAALPVLRQLHELLWYLDEAAGLAPAAALQSTRAAVEQAAASAPDTLLSTDLDALRGVVGPLLIRASAGRRGPRPGADLVHADLAGADLRTTDLRRASLRGALLIGADLRGVELERTDLLGADLRGADIRGARLAAAVYLTQGQVNAATGDARTTLPPRVEHPTHWSA